MKMNPPVQFVTTNDGVRIACSSHGEGGQPLVFVRGWMSHLEQMWRDPAVRAYFEPIASHFRLIRFDVRGLGLSDRSVPPIDVAGMVLDVEAVLDQLDLHDVILYGQCFGGPAAIVYTATHPERVSKLILDGTFALGSAITSAEQQTKFLSTLQTLPQAGYLYLAHLTHPDRTETARPDARTFVASPEVVEHLYALGFATDVTPLLSSISVPTLVMHRQGSYSIPFRLGRELASQIPGSRFVALSGRAHDPWHEDPAQALRAVGDFLGVRFAAPHRQRGDGSAVTILFTDMVGSTRMTQRMGDADAQDVVRPHNDIVRESLNAHAGREIKHTGDGIMASFTSASHALESAVSIQRALAVHRELVGVRIGVNAGEPVAEDGDLFGSAVQLAARICAQAAPGQIVASNVVRELTTGKGFVFADIGESLLSGFSEPVRLYEVRWQTSDS